jgi:hypothetical protein
MSLHFDDLFLLSATVYCVLQFRRLILTVQIVEPIVLLFVTVIFAVVAVLAN